jgi:tetratricopeptide (TPR) repeat protein
LDAAEAVGVAPEGAEPLELDLLDGLGSLVDQSLVQQREEGGEPRFGMLHVIREYAVERLDESGEAEALRRAHVAYALSLAEQVGRQLKGPDQVALSKRLEREHDNLRAALGWSLEHGAPEMAARLCVALFPFWNMSGHWNEQRHWLARTSSLGETLTVQLRAHVLIQAGYVARGQGDYVAATRQLDESLALFRSVDDSADAGDALGQLATVALRQEQFERAEHLFEESLRLLQEVGDRPKTLQVLRAQAELPEVRGDYPAATRLVKQALALAQRLGDTHDVAECTARLGWLALLQGDAAAAEAPIAEALIVQQQLRDTNCSAISLGYLGMRALELGDAAAAQELLEQSLSGFEEIATQPGIARTLIRLGATRLALGNLQGAVDAYLKSLQIERGLANRQRTAACLQGLAEVALARGEPERTARLLGAATQVLGEAPPAPLPPRLAAQQERVAVDAQQLLGQEAWAAAYVAGQALSPEEAIVRAVEAER